MNLLTDLEFRAWVQYILSADDFGVMRCSAVTLQADNDHLSNRPRKVVQRCLETLVTRGLLLAFDHQGRHYVCQWDWQSYQKVEYPRPTFEPKPPQAVLEQCDAKTRGLFDKHPGGSPKRKPKDSLGVPEFSGTGSREIPDYAGGRARETATAKANGSGLTANGSGSALERPPDSRSGRPVFSGHKLTVFEWQLEECVKILGTFTDAFDLHAWFYDLDAAALKANLVIPKRDNNAWLEARLLEEIQKRQLPITLASTPAAGYDAEVAAVIAKGPSKRPW